MTDHRLAYLDQAAYLSQLATGRVQLTQLVWVYEHPLDQMALKAFHQNFGYGLAGRRIERSALPFGRHRWVAATGPAADIDVADGPRPRSALSDWVDERAQTPVDPQRGPGWHLAVLPMTDGSSAVSLVGSHCLFDGLGFFGTIADAVRARIVDLDYPAPDSRSRPAAIAEDLARTLRDIPSVGAALAAGVKLARRRQAQPSGTPARRPEGGAHGNVVVPAVSVFVPLADWDSAANRLGGNGHSLLAGFAAALGQRIGRCRADTGTVALLIAVSDRTDGDTRANALRFARAEVDPDPVGSDLSAARAAVRAAVAAVRDTPDEMFALLPLTPFVPRRAVAGMGNAMFGDLPVSCSNLGAIDPDVARIDGTAAEYVLVRPVDQKVDRAQLEWGGGQLVVAAGRFGDQMSVGVVAYQPGATNTKTRLRALSSGVLDEFGLTGVIV